MDLIDNKKFNIYIKLIQLLRMMIVNNRLYIFSGCIFLYLGGGKVSIIDPVDNCSIYDNSIEYYFHEYFQDRNIELDGHAYKQVPNNLWQGAFAYVYKKLFKPDENTARKFGAHTKLDYDDSFTLNKIIDIYGDLVLRYDIKATQNMFCALTGIHRDTLHNWESNSNRAYIYYNNNGEVITNIREYILNNRGDYTKEPSTTYIDLVKKIKSFSHDTAYNGLNDTPVGQITHANNSREAGMEYNNKRQIETVRAQALSAAELPKLGQIVPDVVQIEQRDTDG